MKSNKSKALIFANSVLGGIVILFIILICYAWYKSTSLQIPYNLKLIVPLTAGLLFSFITLFLRENWKINVAAFIFSLLIAAYGVELVLFAHYKIRFPQAKIDTRNKLEVLEDMRAEGIDAWPQVLASLFVKSDGITTNNNRIFPLGGISNKTVVYCNESGQYKIFKSDEHGLNNPKGLYKKGAVEIALIGDSFTMGSCVKSEEEIAGRLRSKEISTLNFGSGGNGPLIELAVLKEYVEAIAPDIVLWIYFEGNDLSDLGKESRSSILMRYLEDDYSQNLISRQPEIDDGLIKYVNDRWLKEVRLPQMRNIVQNLSVADQKVKEREDRFKPLKLWYLRERLGLVNTTSKPKRKVSFNKQLKLFSDVIGKAYRRSSGWGGKFYFVYLPDMERYINNNDDGDFYDRDDVLSIVHNHGIPVIDFHQVLKVHPEPLSFTPFLGAHYNAEGYKLVSELIIDHLKKDGLASRQ